MEYKVKYSADALKDLDSLDFSVGKRIVKKVSQYAELKNPLIKAKKLTGMDYDTYRFRVGDYRVVFRLDPETERMVILVIVKIAHRKEVYRNMK